MTAEINYRRITIGLAISAFALFLAFGWGQIDLYVTNLFYDASIGDFPLRRSEFTDVYLYQGAKKAAFLLAFILIAMAFHEIRKGKTGLTYRHLSVGVLGSILIPLSAQILKNLTGMECPWSLDLYGGSLTHQPLALALTAPKGAGRCFPAGHSTGGFYLFAWAFMWTGINRQKTIFLAILGIIAGLLMGLTRIAQGAHFVSHVLWSAWFSVLIAMLLHWVLIGSRTSKIVS